MKYQRHTRTRVRTPYLYVNLLTSTKTVKNILPIFQVDSVHINRCFKFEIKSQGYECRYEKLKFSDSSPLFALHRGFPLRPARSWVSTNSLMKFPRFRTGYKLKETNYFIHTKIRRWVNAAEFSYVYASTRTHVMTKYQS